ncbi:MAG: 2-amino-4-hydroxy-6-hydroxymethyldihydropteridine diphosphokinase [Pseudomonadales bacterium]|nr:2-amino-4-hydroxy-6-hydroxymethyldihydropteridine diphosphokinase [Pseudomonadales bacterium]
MARVYLSLGSNIDRERYIRAGLNALEAKFGGLIVSPVYESEAVGFDGDNFYNLVVGIETYLSVGELQRVIKAIEDDNGRVRSGPKFSPRTLDIDILTYDDRVGEVDGVALPRDEILTNAFVLLPLADVAGAELHPQVQRSYAELWADYDKQQQALWPVQLA